VTTGARHARRPRTAGNRGSATTTPKPVRAVGPFAGSVLALGGWAAVAHNSGSGWVQAVGALLAGFLAVGLLAPGLAVRRVRCDAREAPHDVIAGNPVTVTLWTSGPAQVRSIDPPGIDTMIGGRAPGHVTFVPARRGELHEIRLRIASAAPFGLLWWSKEVVVALPHLVVVAPKVGQPDPVVLDEAKRSDRADRRVPATVGEPRGVRVYRPGDLQHWVHWPATAHAGMLMVRDMEGPHAPPVAIRADLPEDPDASEAAAERVFGTVGELLAAGRHVVLVTMEQAGERIAPVTGMLDTGRRLARALPRRRMMALPAATGGPNGATTGGPNTGTGGGPVGGGSTGGPVP
jgi:uncharacterized protein (DUF58 family)